MSTLVLLYLGAGLFSAASHYMMNSRDFDKDDTQDNFPNESSYEMRVVLSIFIDIMTWPAALILKLREKNND